MSNIMVSVYCTAYNHAQYIRSALEGFVSQKTNFKFEVIVHDDASTDGTADIIREYAKKYPDNVRNMSFLMANICVFMMVFHALYGRTIYKILPSGNRAKPYNPCASCPIKAIPTLKGSSNKKSPGGGFIFTSFPACPFRRASRPVFHPVFPTQRSPS